ncbi:hypothetical protein ACD661_08870 [Legionella lytica]|uniref:Transcription factor CBF/NF-Y/archaeal histone domain-containing protein n=1 Tax=Legionella lytica TaxID=96232 RepID=A0ABW8D7I3_9GAMM
MPDSPEIAKEEYKKAPAMLRTVMPERIKIILKNEKFKQNEDSIYFAACKMFTLMLQDSAFSIRAIILVIGYN